MFTGNSIDAKSLAQGLPMTVVRDCTLSYIGKIPTPLPRRVVPCSKPQHIKSAILREGIAGIITTEENASLVPNELGLIIAELPVDASFILHEKLCAIDDFLWKKFDTRIHSSADIHPSAVISEHDVEIGANTSVLPGAIVLPRSIIAANCMIGAGTVIGCDAFEVNVFSKPNRIVQQAGGVRLGEYVEILAKCTIVRATFGGFTQVGRESKFDCQVHLAHDCKVGERVRFAAGSEISGRVDIGNDTFIGPNCSISNGVSIGNNVHVTLGAVVVKNIVDGGHVSGNFAIDHKKLLAHISAIR